MRGNTPPETGSVFIILPRNERLDLVDVGFPHARKFSDFHDPVALEFFGCGLVVHVGQRQAVGIPLAAQKCHNRGLSDTLRSVQNENVVKLDAGFPHSCNSGTERLSGNRPYIGIIRRSKIINEQGVQTRDFIPRRQTV